LEDLEGAPDGLPPKAVKNLMWQLLRALEFCHTHNVVHRDIKPENLLISANGVLKLCDFGFARTLAGPAGRYTDYVSTRWYRAPELLVGDQGYGKAVDIWAVGCLMAEIAHGLPLFPGESDLDQLSHIIWCFGKLTPRLQDLARSNPQFSGAQLPQFAKLDSLQQKLEGVSSEQLDVIQQCLAYEPMQRPTCSDLLRHTYFKVSAELFKTELQAACAADTESKLNPQQPRRAKCSVRVSEVPIPSNGGEAVSLGAAAAAHTHGGTTALGAMPAGGGSAGSGGTRGHDDTHARENSAHTIASDYTSPRSEHGTPADAEVGGGVADLPGHRPGEEAALEAAAEERLRRQLAQQGRHDTDSSTSLGCVQTVEGFGDLGGLAQASLSSVNSDAEDTTPGMGRYEGDVRRQIVSRSGMRSQQRDREQASAAAEGRALDKDWHATAAGIRASLNETLQHEQRLRKLEADRLRLRSQGGLARTRSRGGMFESGAGEGKQSEERHGLDASGSVGNLTAMFGERTQSRGQRAAGGLRSIVAATGASGSSDDGSKWAHGAAGRKVPPRTLPSMSSGEGSAGDGEASGDERMRGGAAAVSGMAPRIVAMPPPGLDHIEHGSSDSKSSGHYGGGKVGDPETSGAIALLGGRFRQGLGALQGLRPLPSLNEIDDDGAGSFGLGGSRSRNTAGGNAPVRSTNSSAGLYLGGVALQSSSGGGSGAAATGALRALGVGGLQPQRTQGQTSVRGGWQPVPPSSGLGAQPQGLRAQPPPGSSASRWGGLAGASRGGSGMGVPGVAGGQLRSHRPMALSGMGLGLSQRSHGGGAPTSSSHRFGGSSAGFGSSVAAARRVNPRGAQQSYSQRGRMALRGGTGLSNLRMA